MIKSILQIWLMSSGSNNWERSFPSFCSLVKITIYFVSIIPLTGSRIQNMFWFLKLLEQVGIKYKYSWSLPLTIEQPGEEFSIDNGKIGLNKISL